MIALIAGTGALPGLLAEALVARGDPPVICEMAGFVPDVPADLQHLRFRLETLGTLLHSLRDMGVTRICLAGAVRRPVIDPTLIDAATQPLIAPLVAAMAKGDDGTLRGIIALLEAAGFTVVGADQIALDALPPAGTFTRVKPTREARADAKVGLAEIRRLGQADMGQACVVHDGQVIASEDAAGTDAMLQSLCNSAPASPSSSGLLSWFIDPFGVVIDKASDWVSGPRTLTTVRTGGILVKAPKPGQDRQRRARKVTDGRHEL